MCTIGCQNAWQKAFVFDEFGILNMYVVTFFKAREFEGLVEYL